MNKRARDNGRVGRRKINQFSRDKGVINRDRVDTIVIPTTPQQSLSFNCDGT